MKDKIEKVEEYIKNNYKARCCGYTMFRSEGNYDDVFNDRADYGEAWSLYDIAEILGMEVEEPEENKIDNYN
jgi:hypothetical protein